MRFQFFKWAMVAALALSVMASDAYAGNRNEDKGNGKGRGKHVEDSASHHSEGHHDDDKVTIRIGGSERDIIAGFLRDDHHSHCPPGLAKKNNGCLPPGQAKKYAVGSVLPPDVVALPLPDSLLDLLGAAPHGYQYVQVDKDILLIGEASKKVIDAVTLLSAVGE